MQSVVGVAMVPEAILEKLEPMGMTPTRFLMGTIFLVYSTRKAFLERAVVELVYSTRSLP